MRINEEIRLLSHIPTGLDPKAAANLFRNRRQPAIEERGIEALTERVGDTGRRIHAGRSHHQPIGKITTQRAEYRGCGIEEGEKS